MLLDTPKKTESTIEESNKSSNRCLTPEKPYEEKFAVADHRCQKPHTPGTLEILMQSISERLTVAHDGTINSVAVCNAPSPSSPGSGGCLGNIDRFPAVSTNSLSPKQTPRSILRKTSTSSKSTCRVIAQDENDVSIERFVAQRSPMRSVGVPSCTVRFHSEDQVMRAETQVVTLKYLMKELFKTLEDHSKSELYTLGELLFELISFG